MSKSGPVQVLIICHYVHVSWMYKEQDAVNDSLQELFASYFMHMHCFPLRIYQVT